MSNPLTELLRPHVAALEAAVVAGDADARQVVVWYENYRKCPEPGAQVVCEEAFKAWREKCSRTQ